MSEIKISEPCLACLRSLWMPLYPNFQHVFHSIFTLYCYLEMVYIHHKVLTQVSNISVLTAWNDLVLWLSEIVSLCKASLGVLIKEQAKFPQVLDVYVRIPHHIIPLLSQKKQKRIPKRPKWWEIHQGHRTTTDLCLVLPCLRAGHDHSDSLYVNWGIPDWIVLAKKWENW